MILASLSPTTGPLLAAAALLAAAGAAKLERPAPTGLALARLGLPGSDPLVRALGGAEVAAATAAAFFAGWWALPVAGLYLGFALFSAAQVRRATTTGEAADCGCFGDSSAPIGRSHVLINLGLAGAAALAAASGADGLLTGLSDDLVHTLEVTALAALASVGLRALLTDLPALRALRGTEAA